MSRKHTRSCTASSVRLTASQLWTIIVLVFFIPIAWVFLIRRQDDTTTTSTTTSSPSTFTSSPLSRLASMIASALGQRPALQPRNPALSTSCPSSAPSLQTSNPVLPPPSSPAPQGPCMKWIVHPAKNPHVSFILENMDSILGKYRCVYGTYPTPAQDVLYATTGLPTSTGIEIRLVIRRGTRFVWLRVTCDPSKGTHRLIDLSIVQPAQFQELLLL